MVKIKTIMKYILTLIVGSSIIFSCADAALSEIEKIVSEVDHQLDGKLTYRTTLDGSNPMPPIIFFYDGNVTAYTGGFITYSVYEKVSAKNITLSTYEVIDKNDNQVVFHDYYYLEKVKEKKRIAEKFLKDIKLKKIEDALEVVDTNIINKEALIQLSSILDSYELNLQFRGLKMSSIEKKTYGEVLYEISDSNLFFITFNLNEDDSSIVGFGMNP